MKFKSKKLDPRKLAGKPFRTVKSLAKIVFSVPKKVWTFLKSVKNELKLVNWLNKKETAKWSTAVLLTALATGGFIALLDFIFYNLRNLLFSINV